MEDAGLSPATLDSVLQQYLALPGPSLSRSAVLNGLEGGGLARRGHARVTSGS